MKSISVFLVCFLAGCATSVTTNAERVKISNNEPGKECKFLGDVTGSQGNRITRFVTSNEQMETGARNELKNKAAEIGGNVVVLLMQRDGRSTSTRGGS